MEATFRQFKNKIESWPNWYKCQTIVLAISGGVDSMVLLHLMIQLMTLNEYKDRQLVIAHFNHRLRSQKDHAQEEALVVQVAEKYGLVYFVSMWDNPTKTNIEANARRARYQFLADVLNACDGDCLMTAHHLDDAVETMFMRMIRGTSLKGLAGIRDNYQRLMKASNGESLTTFMMRPLINFRKDQLYQYATQEEIQYFEDESNHSERYLRNRVRLDYLPQIEQENPQFYHNLFSMQAQLNASYQAHYQAYLKQEPFLLGQLADNRWILDVEAWRQLSPQLREVFLTLFFEERFIQAAGSYDKDVITQLTQQILNIENPNYQLNIASGWLSRREYEYIIIEPEGLLNLSKPNIRVDLSRQNKWHSLENGLWIGLFHKSFVNNQMKQAVDDYLAIDLSKCDKIPNFHVRHRQAGDIIQLSSGQGEYHKKISRILIDEKMPASHRGKMWLVVENENEVLWLIGQLSSSRYQPQKSDQITHYFLIQQMY